MASVSNRQFFVTVLADDFREDLPARFEFEDIAPRFDVDLQRLVESIVDNEREMLPAAV
jgi:hypothetical protein